MKTAGREFSIGIHPNHSDPSYLFFNLQYICKLDTLPIIVSFIEAFIIILLPFWRALYSLRTFHVSVIVTVLPYTGNCVCDQSVNVQSYLSMYMC